MKKSKKTGPLEKTTNDFIKECIKNTTGRNAFDYIEFKLGMFGSSITVTEEEEGYQIKPALREMLDKKVSRRSIIDLVRVVQMDMMWTVLEAFEGTYSEKCSWKLFTVDKDGNPVEPIPEEHLTVTFSKYQDIWLPKKRNK